MLAALVIVLTKREMVHVNPLPGIHVTPLFELVWIVLGLLAFVVSLTKSASTLIGTLACSMPNSPKNKKATIQISVLFSSILNILILM